MSSIIIIEYIGAKSSSILYHIYVFLVKPTPSYQSIGETGLESLKMARRTIVDNNLTSVKSDNPNPEIEIKPKSLHRTRKNNKKHYRPYQLRSVKKEIKSLCTQSLMNTLF